MVCQGVSPPTQIAIERSTPPPPTEPEIKITNEMVLLKLILDDRSRPIRLRQRRNIERRLQELDAMLSEWIPTRYRPDPSRKGGK